MILGIDASNIRVGGGVTHIVELLRAASPADYGFSKVVIWSCRKTLDQIEDRPWIEKVHETVFEKNIFHRMLWQRYKLSECAVKSECDLLFVPGGSFAGDFRPVVAMSQNLLPFEWRELRRYGLSLMFFKMLLLRVSQSLTFKKADGVIFLTEYAKLAVSTVVGDLRSPSVVIPLGVHSRFLVSGHGNKVRREFTDLEPCRALYVSVVDVYKHQWNVVAAIRALRDKGIPISLDLVGPGEGEPLERLKSAIKGADPEGRFVRFLGKVPHDQVADLYRHADLNIFASSCENMPNILIEAMASSVCVACSDRGPMPEVLQDCGVYFDPENVDTIAASIEDLLGRPSEMLAFGRRANALASRYSWSKCAADTFAFFRTVALARTSGDKRIG